MEISPANGLTTVSGASTEASAPVISSDFETFLRMLTAQLQNQDPLNPVESDDYAVQLATFSSVEQQVLTNQLLEGLIGAFAPNGIGQYAGWVGMDARAAMPAYFDGTPITISPNPISAAEQVELIVYDDIGLEVARQQIPVSAEPFEWAGLDAEGNPLPEGLYSFDVASYQEGEIVDQIPAEIYARVLEAQSYEGTTILVLEGGVRVDVSSVTAIRDAPSLPDPTADPARIY